MRKNTRYYVSRRNAFAWLMALCMLCSAVTRIVFAGMKGTGGAAFVWSQIVLPIAACVLFALIVLIRGKEYFFKSAIPVFLICVYFIFVFNGYGFGHYHRMIVTLYAIALLFIAIFYRQITCGKMPFSAALIPLLAFPMAALIYLNRVALRANDVSVYQKLLPDALMTLGLLFTVFAMGVHPAGEYHPTWGDRNDGRRIRTEPPMNQVSPYIMVNRIGSMNTFEQAFEMTAVEHYIRQKRREGLVNFGPMHVLLACYCRCVAKYPGLNRFISGQKIYSHGNDISFCMTVKKEMSVDSPESLIKVHLTPYDTAVDVYNKLNAEIENVKNTPLDSTFDNTAMIFTMLPGLLLKFAMWLIRTVDYFGGLPKFLLEISPFHGSVFFTSMGSLGIPPIYHHLYDFGNLPLFGSFGCKRRELEIQEDGSVVQRKYIDCKFTMDERIVDGFYYAAFFKLFKRIWAHPEVLDEPPAEVVSDID